MISIILRICKDVKFCLILPLLCLTSHKHPFICISLLVEFIPSFRSVKLRDGFFGSYYVISR